MRTHGFKLTLYQYHQPHPKHPGFRACCSVLTHLHQHHLLRVWAVGGQAPQQQKEHVHCSPPQTLGLRLKRKRGAGRKMAHLIFLFLQPLSIRKSCSNLKLWFLSASSLFLSPLFSPLRLLQTPCEFLINPSHTLNCPGWSPSGSDGKESASNMGDLGSIPRLGRSPGGGHGNPLQYSCLENPHGEEPGRLQSTGWQRIRHDWATKHSTTRLTLFHSPIHLSSLQATLSLGLKLSSL